VQYAHTGQKVLQELMQSFPQAVLRAPLGVAGVGDLGLDHGDAEQLREPMPGLTLTDVQATLWNAETALVVLTYEVQPSAPLGDPAWLRRSRVKVWELEGAIERLMAKVTGWDDATFAALWVNSVYVLAVDPAVGQERRRQIAGAVGTNGLDVALEAYPSAVVRVAQNCCVVSDDLADPAIELLVGLVAVHHVCWGAALVLDAALNREIELVGVDLRVAPAELERQGARILTTYLRVRRFRLGYTSVEAHLDAGAARLWEGLERAWKFNTVLQTVDDRLDFVRTLHGQLQTRLQDGRSRVLNEIVLVFTFLNLFSIALASLTFAELPSVYAGVAPLLAMIFLLVVNVGAYLGFKRRFYAR
jgi:hypothetical protein